MEPNSDFSFVCHSRKAREKKIQSFTEKDISVKIIKGCF